MSFTDKIKNSAEELAGKAKEVAGSVTGNDRLEAEGQADQGKAQLKKAGESIKDRFSR